MAIKIYYILVNRTENKVAKVSLESASLQKMIDWLSKSKPLLASRWAIEKREGFVKEEEKTQDDFKDYEKF